MPSSRHPVWLVHLPNAMGVLRLLAAPLLLVLVLHGNFAAAAWTYLLAGLTDAVDGAIARRLGVDSAFGRMIDPIADKTLINAGFVAAASQGMLPWWIAWLVLGRDLMILASFAIARLSHRQLHIRPAGLSKLNTLFQVSLGTLAIGRVAYDFPLDPWLGYLVLATAATTIASALYYLLRWFNEVRGSST